MRHVAKIRVGGAVLVAACLLAGVGCSKTDGPATAAGTTAPAAAVTTALGADPTKAPCSADVLVPVIQAKYGTAGVDHLVCLAPNAILTVKTPGGDTAALLQQKAGAWTIAADGPASDAEKLLPKDFPLSIVRSWEDKRTPTTPTSKRSGGGAAPTLPPGRTCTGEGSNQTCVTEPPPAPPPTTAKPTTTSAPVTQPPTTAPAPPTTFSQFCLENPLDPSCSGKK